MTEVFEFLLPSSAPWRVLLITVTLGMIIALAEIAGSALRWDKVETIAWAFTGVAVMAMLTAYGPLRPLLPSGDPIPLWGKIGILLVGALIVFYLQLLLLNAGTASSLTTAHTFAAGIIAPVIMIGIFWLWEIGYHWAQKVFFS